MRALSAGFALIAVGVLLAGCAATDVEPAAERSPLTASPSPAAVVDEQDPLELIGQWRITEAAGEEPGTVVRIGFGAVQIWRSCGDVEASWVANHSELRARTNGYAQTCNPLPTVTWLENAASYAVAAEGVTVRADDGSVIALLARDESAAPAGRGQLGTVPTVVDDRARKYFAGVFDWPEDVEPVGPDDISGRWVPRGEFATDPHVVFSSGGRWTGTDGCNGGGGRRILTEDGSFASTSGAMFLVGCDGAPAPDWVMMARAMGVDGDELVLLDLDGDELGRLVRP